MSASQFGKCAYCDKPGIAKIQGRDACADHIPDAFRAIPRPDQALSALLKRVVTVPMIAKRAEKMIRDGLIQVDPKICFGRPTVMTWHKGYVPTERIRERICAGQCLSDLSEDLSISYGTIVDALRYELLCSSPAKARAEEKCDD